MIERFKKLNLTKTDYFALSAPFIGNILDTASTARGFYDGSFHHELCTVPQHLTVGGNLLPFFAVKFLSVTALQGAYLISKEKTSNRRIVDLFRKTFMFELGAAFFAAAAINTFGGVPSIIADNIPC